MPISSFEAYARQAQARMEALRGRAFNQGLTQAMGVYPRELGGTGNPTSSPELPPLSIERRGMGH